MAFGDDILLKILIQVLEKLVTPASVKQAETYIVEALAALAKKTDSKVDDALVKVVADALGIPVPV